MIPSEKAKELVDKFSTVGLQQRNEGIQCALIAVNELIDSHLFLTIRCKNYWKEVKQEIEKL